MLCLQMKSDSAAPQKKYKSKRQKRKYEMMLLQTCEKTFAMLLKATVMQVKKKFCTKKKIILLCCDQAGQFSIIHERKINFLFSKK